MSLNKIPNKKAFTLIELSIVLTIIAIIIGLVLSANTLTKNSQYRSVISDLQTYLISVKNFQNRYNSLPGDMSDFSSYWSAVPNGNGDGKIGIGDGSDPIGESALAWKHLSVSGLISGNYTGITAGTPSYINGQNTPTTPIIGGFYSLYYFNSTNGIYGKIQNAISFASNSSIPWNNSILSPKDAYEIDLKADDGSPYGGEIFIIRGSEYTGSSGKCVSSDYNSNSASYVFTDDSVSCRLLFWLR